ncbi:hypothetical protein HK101_006887 [Irineochytrium annulatum]|nr:hypothetical protein HK101_006887 [Irineochytrium annulatum]
MAESGVVDVVVEDEGEAVKVAKRCLAVLADRKMEVGHVREQEALRGVVPGNRLRVYDMRTIIDIIADFGTTVELQRQHAPSMITVLGAIGGRAIGIAANDPAVGAGALDGPGARKLVRFASLCKRRGLPLLTLCDTPGFMVGPDAERTGQARSFGDLFRCMADESLVILTVVIRKGVGLGAMAMAGGGFHQTRFTVSWPFGEFSGMGIEGAVRLGFRRQMEAIEAGPKRKEFFEAKVEEMLERGKAVNAAEFLEVDAVIDPADTRSWVIRGLDMLAGVPKL